MGKKAPLYGAPKVVVGGNFHSHWEAGLAGSEAGFEAGRESLKQEVRREASFGTGLGRPCSGGGWAPTRDGRPRTRPWAGLAVEEAGQTAGTPNTKTNIS